MKDNEGDGVFTSTYKIFNKPGRDETPVSYAHTTSQGNDIVLLHCTKGNDVFSDERQ